MALGQGHWLTKVLKNCYCIWWMYKQINLLKFNSLYTASTYWAYGQDHELRTVHHRQSQIQVSYFVWVMSDQVLLKISIYQSSWISFILNKFYMHISNYFSQWGGGFWPNWPWQYRSSCKMISFQDFQRGSRPVVPHLWICACFTTFYVYKIPTCFTCNLHV